MPVLTDDLVHQTSTTTGTGAKALVAVNGRRGLEDVFGAGGTDVFYYYVSNRDAAEWEFGSGHIDVSGDLVGDTVIKSSNSNAAVNFSAGTKDITSDWPAEKQAIHDRELFDGVSLCALARASGVAQFAGDRFGDSFGALTYVDTAGAANLDSSTPGLLKPASNSTSYANAGGTGNRTSSITVTGDAPVTGTLSTMVDGSQSGTIDGNNGVAVSGTNLRFDFGSGQSKVITEAKFYADNGTAEGTWKWQGSDDASSWTDVSASFSLVGATSGAVIGDMSANTTGYRYYQMLGVSGSMASVSTPFWREFEFKIADAPLGTQDVSVASQGITPVNNPSRVVLVARVKHVDAATAGTDYNFTVSRNGGSNYSSNLTLHDRFTDPTDSCHVIESDPMDVSAQTSPTTIKWKWVTANNKVLELRDIYFRGVP